MDYEDEKPKEVAWNLSQILIAELGSLLKQASDNYIKRNFGTAFDCLKSAKNRIVSSLEESEVKEFEDKEKEILQVINAGNSVELRMNNPVLYNKATKLVYLRIDYYNNLLMTKLKKYGYLIPNKEDKTQMNA